MAFLYVLGQTMTLVPPHLATCNKATCSGPFTSTDQANEVLVAVLPRLARRAKFDRSYDNGRSREGINQRGSKARISREKHPNATQRPIASIYAAWRPPSCGPLPLGLPCIHALHILRLAELLNFALVVDTPSGEEMNLSEPGSRVIFVWLSKF
jgi:hypothetical protein